MALLTLLARLTRSPRQNLDTSITSNELFTHFRPVSRAPAQKRAVSYLSFFFTSMGTLSGRLPCVMRAHDLNAP